MFWGRFCDDPYYGKIDRKWEITLLGVLPKFQFIPYRLHVPVEMLPLL
jgi:hypothetical protein